VFNEFLKALMAYLAVIVEVTDEQDKSEVKLTNESNCRVKKIYNSRNITVQRARIVVSEE